MAKINGLHAAMIGSGVMLFAVIGATIVENKDAIKTKFNEITGSKATTSSGVSATTGV